MSLATAPDNKAHAFGGVCDIEESEEDQQGRSIVTFISWIWIKLSGRQVSVLSSI
jgi:hypothetical protein